MRTKTLLVIATALACVAPSLAFDQEKECACKDLPSFSLRGTDGQQYTQGNIADKATVIVFIAHGCPHNKKAAPDWNRVSKLMGTKARVLGVINTDPATAKTYAKTLGLTFPLLSDKDSKAIEAFGAKHSLDSVLICGKDKRVAKQWEGYSRATIGEIFADLPGHGGPTVKPDLKLFPEKKQSGCSL